MGRNGANVQSLQSTTGATVQIAKVCRARHSPLAVSLGLRASCALHARFISSHLFFNPPPPSTPGFRGGRRGSTRHHHRQRDGRPQLRAHAAQQAQRPHGWPDARLLGSREPPLQCPRRQGGPACLAVIPPSGRIKGAAWLLFSHLASSWSFRAHRLASSLARVATTSRTSSPSVARGSTSTTPRTSLRAWSPRGRARLATRDCPWALVVAPARSPLTMAPTAARARSGRQRRSRSPVRCSRSGCYQGGRRRPGRARPRSALGCNARLSSLRHAFPCRLFRSRLPA